MVATLCYWKIRGLAQPIRLLLEYTKTPYDDKYPATREQWFEDKFNFGLDFPNLPYYIDGDLKLSQTNAILRYLARKNGMEGKTEREIQLIDMLEGALGDLRWQWTLTCYMPLQDFEKDKKKYIEETVPMAYKQYSAILGEQKWFVGENISYVDFIMYELLDINRILEPTSLDKFPNLAQYMTSFESLAAIKNYLKSERCLKWPLNSAMAKFGG